MFSYLVQSPCTISGQETERVNSYNPGARTGPGSFKNKTLALCGVVPGEGLRVVSSCVAPRAYDNLNTG